MAQEMPRYVLAAPPESLARVRDALRPLEPLTEVGSVDELLADGEAAPGWIFLPPGVAAGEIEDLLVALGRRTGGWSPVLLRESNGELRALPLSPGFIRPVDEVVARVRAGGPDASFVSFRYALGILSRIRHDVNNPLTAALAETQLLRMDAEEGSEEAQSLKVVEEQLQRIRNLIALLNALRPPRD